MTFYGLKPQLLLSCGLDVSPSGHSSASLFGVHCPVAPKTLGAENAFRPAARQCRVTAGNPSHRRCCAHFLSAPCLLASSVQPEPLTQDCTPQLPTDQALLTWMLWAGWWQRTRPRGWPRETRRAGPLSAAALGGERTCEQAATWGFAGTCLEVTRASWEHTSLHSQTRH